LDRALRSTGHLDGDLGRELALAEEADAVAHAAQNAARDQGRAVDRGLGVDPVGVDGGLQRARVDDNVPRAEGLLEAALRHPPVERRLTALEAGKRDAA